MFRYYFHRREAIIDELAIESLCNELAKVIKEKHSEWDTKIKEGNRFIPCPDSAWGYMIFAIYTVRDGTFLAGIPESDHGRLLVYEDWIVPQLSKMLKDRKLVKAVSDHCGSFPLNLLIDVID